MPVAQIPLLGLGNQENVLAAVSVGSIFHVPPPLIRRAIGSFRALPHRLENIGIYHEVTFYNDSLATVPVATTHALAALGSSVQTLIAGGFDRGVDYTHLGRYIARDTALKTLILFPDTGQTIWQAVTSTSPRVSIAKYNVHTMKEAVEIAYRVTEKGKVCLLSPASASFNLFKNYKERGNLFKHYVKALS